MAATYMRVLTVALSSSPCSVGASWESGSKWLCSQDVAIFSVTDFITLSSFWLQIKCYWLNCVSPRRRQWHPTPVLLPGKSQGRRSLIGCCPWGRKESDTTEQLHSHSSLSCVGKGNGNPLQCSCLENPKDGGAWWAAIYGVAQNQTQLKRLSSSSSIHV